MARQESTKGFVAAKGDAAIMGRPMGVARPKRFAVIYLVGHLEFFEIVGLVSTLWVVGPNHRNQFPQLGTSLEE